MKLQAIQKIGVSIHLSSRVAPPIAKRVNIKKKQKTNTALSVSNITYFFYFFSEYYKK